MFRSKTLFILGAGSSAEVGMPVGEKLKSLISNKLNIEYDGYSNLTSGDRGIARALLRYAERDGSYSDLKVRQQIEKAQSLRRALPHAISIDNLLDARRDDKVAEICGKLGIFQSILEAERRSQIFVSERKPINFGALNDAWFSYFVKILAEDVSKEEVGIIFNNVAFINFNYDRCLEHYLMHALLDYYDLEEKTAIDTVKRLKVLRPYGSVGKLSWQDDNPNFSTAFGDDRYLANNDLYSLDKGVQLLNAANQIKTFNEKNHEPQALKELHAILEEAENIVFLGFAFHRQNLELLKPEGQCKVQNVFATTMGVSGSDWSIIHRELVSLLVQKPKNSIPIHSLNGRCSELFKEYRRSFTAN